GIAGNAAHGSRITLIARQRIDQRARIDASGSMEAGMIILQAGDDIALDGRLRAVAGAGSGISGGTVVFDAGGRVTCSARCGVDGRGNGPGAGGRALYSGVAAVDLVGHLVAEGGTGPHLEFRSGAGAVTLGTDIRMDGRLGAGGDILLVAATEA